ncbi:hypothetical protein CXIVA_07780 [Clostridium sp. SY8519]|uniref:relaxase/mobilization nuclease domain-containing protein n=1 Tax=Clostridium sp. (strain SY8519) TaxID=1042156 RepID=UPI0002172026|nr:relaxase/mobilization nuclease domain-containing protein [Clostridium sp. SY8519]BAK46745.1 hypothetical protein CXIVA_07780 [Clostridium sp. SY8519]
MAITKIITGRQGAMKTHGSLRNCIRYVSRPDKVKDHYIAMTGPAPEVLTEDSVYRSFLAEKKMWEKDSGRMYRHTVLSFHRDEPITPETAFEIGKVWAEEAYPGFQTLVSVHQDKEHTHIHLVTNSVSYIDGLKLSQSKADLYKMRNLTDRLCKEHNLSITRKGHHFDGREIERGEIHSYNKDAYNLIAHNPGKSYLVSCAQTAMASLEGCTSREEYCTRMQEQGWTVNWSDKRKYITYQDQDGHKVRDRKINKTFNLDVGKEGLSHEFERNCELQRAEQRVEDAELERYYERLEAEEFDQEAGRDYSGSSERDQRSEKSKTATIIRNSDAAEQSAESERQDREAERIRQDFERQRAAEEAERKAKARSRDRSERSR